MQLLSSLGPVVDDSSLRTCKFWLREPPLFHLGRDVVLLRVAPFGSSTVSSYNRTSPTTGPSQCLLVHSRTGGLPLVGQLSMDNESEHVWCCALSVVALHRDWPRRARPGPSRTSIRCHLCRCTLSTCGTRSSYTAYRTGVNRIHSR